MPAPLADQQLSQLCSQLAHCLDGALAAPAPEQLADCARQLDALLGTLLSLDGPSLARLLAQQPPAGGPCAPEGKKV